MINTLTALFFAAAAVAPPAAGDARLFALVVANNQSGEPGVPALRFADDDAARFYELFASVAGAEVELLALLDAETQGVFPGLSAVARAPTAAELSAAMERLVAAMTSARARGERTTFYFYYAGHGNVGSDREGYLHLADGRLTRSELFRGVLARSHADVNHVLIDACNSYFVINRGRPSEPRPAAAIRSFLAAESLDALPNTGVVLSTASEAESHEWSRFRSGVFSHELLSALWGAAEIDADHRIDYAELAAYVAAANLRVRDVRARLMIFARPPAGDQRAALFDLRALRPPPAPTHPGRGATLVLPPAMSGRFYLEDDRGLRFADFHKSAEGSLRLALLQRPYYYLRSPDAEALLRLEADTEIDAGALVFTPLSTGERGAVEQSLLADLFAVPFGPSFLAGHRAARELAVPTALDLRPPPPASLAAWRWPALGVSTATLAAGVVLQVLAARAGAELDAENRLTMTEAARLQQRQVGLQAGAAASFGVAAVSTALTIWAFASEGSRAHTD